MDRICVSLCAALSVHTYEYVCIRLYISVCVSPYTAYTSFFVCASLRVSLRVGLYEYLYVSVFLYVFEAGRLID